MKEIILRALATRPMEIAELCYAIDYPIAGIRTVWEEVKMLCVDGLVTDDDAGRIHLV